MDIVGRKVGAMGIRRAVVRSMLPCNVLNVIDAHHLIVVAEKQLGMPTTFSLDHRGKVFSIDDVLQAAKWEFGYEAPFAIQFPADFLNASNTARELSLEAIAESHISSETQRVESLMVTVHRILGISQNEPSHLQSARTYV